MYLLNLTVQCSERHVYLHTASCAQNRQFNRFTRVFLARGLQHIIRLFHRFAVDVRDVIAAQLMITLPTRTRRSAPRNPARAAAVPLLHTIDQQPGTIRKVQRPRPISVKECRQDSNRRFRGRRPLRKSSNMRLARLIGIANPMPTLPPDGP